MQQGEQQNQKDEIKNQTCDEKLCVSLNSHPKWITPQRLNVH